jgi:hypothetical protein
MELFSPVFVPAIIFCEKQTDPKVLEQETFFPKLLSPFDSSRNLKDKKGNLNNAKAEAENSKPNLTVCKGR